MISRLAELARNTADNALTAERLLYANVLATLALTEQSAEIARSLERGAQALEALTHHVDDGRSFYVREARSR